MQRTQVAQMWSRYAGGHGGDVEELGALGVESLVRERAGEGEEGVWLFVELRGFL